METFSVIRNGDLLSYKEWRPSVMSGTRICLVLLVTSLLRENDLQLSLVVSSRCDSNSERSGSRDILIGVSGYLVQCSSDETEKIQYFFRRIKEKMSTN